MRSTKRWISWRQIRSFSVADSTKPRGIFWPSIVTPRAITISSSAKLYLPSEMNRDTYEDEVVVVELESSPGTASETLTLHRLRWL